MPTLPSLGLATVIAAATYQPVPLPLERIHQDPPLEGTPPSQVSFAPNGGTVAFLRANEKDSDVLDLWGARLPDGKPELLVSSAALLAGAEQKLTEAEKMALERRRISKRGITSYLWCGKAGDALLFPLSGDLYFARFTPTGLQTKKLTNDEAPELVPQCSPSGKQVVFTRGGKGGGDVVVLDIQSGKARTLTKGASATRTFGLAEFIAEEEMDRHEGTWWSPDEKKLLVFEVDESSVGVKVRAQIFADRTEMFEQRYPAAGEKNAVVKAHLVDIATGKSTPVKTPAADGYLPRAGFFKDNTPWIQWQSRDQKRLELFTINPQGVLARVLEETDDAWVELHEDLKDLGPDAFLWSSEKSGRRQLEVVQKKDGARRPLTSMPEPISGVLALDDKAGVVYFGAHDKRGKEHHVYAIALTGGAPRKLTAGSGWFGAVFDDTAQFYTETHSSLGLPPATVVKRVDGKELLTLAARDMSGLGRYLQPRARFIDLPAADGTTMLNALLLSPSASPAGSSGKQAFEGKAPLIVALYGGPGAQTVADRWFRGWPLYMHWTANGYGVLLVDNRGMAGRDRAFTRAHKDAFGDVEVKDVIAAVNALKADLKGHQWFDLTRIGVFGWSYGGFLASRLMLEPNTPFRCGAAGAPVTDWTLYDTHYTERYIGMPTDSSGAAAKTYASSNLNARAKDLQGGLLLLHGTADDNVLFEHSLRFIEALQKEGKVFDLAIYPGKAHGVSGKTAQLHVQRTVSGFFGRCLLR